MASAATSPTTRSRTKLSEVPRPTPARAEAARRDVSQDEIAARAYELYCERGCEDGHDVEDWLEAERQLAG